MALFGVGRGRARDKEAVPGPAVFAPRRGLDGWTLEGTPLAGRFSREDLRELATLMHGVSAGMETAWTYERAAEMLERAGERPQALAVLDAYFELAEPIHEANSGLTRTLARRRQRLRRRLGIRPPRHHDAPAPLALPAGSEARPLAPARPPLALPAAPEKPPPAPPVVPPPPDTPPPLVIPPRPTRSALPAAPPEPRR